MTWKRLIRVIIIVKYNSGHRQIIFILREKEAVSVKKGNSIACSRGNNHQPFLFLFYETNTWNVKDTAALGNLTKFFPTPQFIAVIPRTRGLASVEICHNPPFLLILNLT